MLYVYRERSFDYGWRCSMLYFCSDPSIIDGDAARCMSTESDLLIIVGNAACCMSTESDPLIIVGDAAC